MVDLVKIGNDTINSDAFLKLLKLNGAYHGLLEEIIKNKLVVLAAKKSGIEISAEEVQARADELRRVRGLHRAKDMMEFLKAMKITLEEFDEYVVDTLYREKMQQQITTDKSVEEYFKLNSPRFDRVEISHIVVDSEGKAKEIKAIASDGRDGFAALAKQHSIADTASSGGAVGRVLRGILPPEIESKVFNAEPGEILGPFQFGEGGHYEIFRVESKTPAALDEETTSAVRNMLFEEWLKGQASEQQIAMLY